MVKTKKIISFMLVLTTMILILSSLMIPVSAASQNNCKWNTKYNFVTAKGESYGTNTFTIYGKLSKRTVTLKSECTVLGQDCIKKFLKTVDFSVKIYKGSTLKQSYTIGLNETFSIPKGLGTKYTVKITPIIDKKAFYKVGGYGLECYYKYSLYDGKIK